MSGPSAYFDTLSLGEYMTDLVEGFSRTELHLFAYAACLLSIYDGQPVADWGYEFVSTDTGLPFSQELDEAMDEILALDYTHLHNRLLMITSGGRGELASLRQLEGYRERDRFLRGAGDALLVLNPGNIREAFNYEPSISYLRKGNRTDWVLTTPVVDRLYGNFQQLRAALAYNARDLSVPLISWLKYLLQTGRSFSHGSSPAN